MTLRIKCKQCGFDHISNIYRLEEHNFHRNFSNLESCPSCGYVSKCDESDYKSLISQSTMVGLIGYTYWTI